MRNKAYLYRNNNNFYLRRKELLVNLNLKLNISREYFDTYVYI